MNNDYKDITSKINEDPQWWDENAVPRYCEFHPFQASDIYADTVVLVLIRCQACHKQFKVAFSETQMTRFNAWRAYQWHRDRVNDTVSEYDSEASQRFSLENSLKTAGYLHYGDPPNFCCGVGATMNSEPIKVLEWWEQKKPFDVKETFSDSHGFIRRPELEVEFDES